MANCSIAILLTSHNRRDRTLAALSAVVSQSLLLQTELICYLVDAGSTDGTAAAVMQRFPGIAVIEQRSDIYWNQGMRLAFEVALRKGHDYYLWLNDDTNLDHDALSRFLDLAGKLPDRSIVVGCTRAQETGEHTYGGMRRLPGIHPLRFELVPLASSPVQVDVMNGNCVLISDAVARLVGNLDPAFSHSIGDFDYGLRAKRLGCEIWTAPGTVGTCSRNSSAGTWRDGSLPVARRINHLRSPKGLPPREWAVFARRHGGTAWPVFWSIPYLKLGLSIVRNGILT